MHSETTWQAWHREAEAALKAGAPDRARRALDAARAAAPGTLPVALLLAEADWRALTGQAAAAEAYLAEHATSYPGNAWLPFKLAELARARGATEGAWAHLGQALALDPGGNVSLRLLAADLWLDAGQGAQAERALSLFAAAQPEDIWALYRLARMAEAQGRTEAARRHIAAARARAPARVDLLRAEVQIVAAGDKGAAADLLGAFRADHADGPGADPDLAVQQLRLHRQAGRPDEALLAELLAAHPREPRLLQDVFRFRGTFTDGPRMERVCALLEGRVPADLHAQLLAQTKLHRARPAAALAHLRRPGARRDRTEAQMLAEALLGARQVRPGWRYLRHCLRRWPESPVFAGLFVHQGLRLGRIDEVAAGLERLNETLDPVQRHGFAMTLAGFRGDLGAAAAEYRALQEMEALNATHRTQLSKLVFTLLDPAKSEEFFETVEHPFARFDKPMHRGGLPGQMMQEFDLERRALPQGAGWSAKDWMQARPGSTMAAIRLIDAWRAEPSASPPPEGAEIPAQVFQYWHEAALPEEIAALTQSWKAAAGEGYRLHDRTSALAYLRETFDPGFVQAFRLAQNPAQEADFLRLCLLAQEGGVWADIDDVLYGDLAAAMAPGRGLVVYREPNGGAIGNNFLAAPPGHPVIRHAARLAAMALRRRDNETTWSKTGPGLVTRALGHYLARRGDGEAGLRITVRDWPGIAAEVAMHADLPYKRSPAHWDPKQPTRHTPVWESLLMALEPGDPGTEPPRPAGGTG